MNASGIPLSSRRDNEASRFADVSALTEIQMSGGDEREREDNHAKKCHALISRPLFWDVARKVQSRPTE